MKLLFFKLSTIIIFSLQFACCGVRNSSRYTLELPEMPQPWVQLLGEPNWRIEWLNVDGKKQSKDILFGETMEVEIPVTWTNPVIAYPWWSRYNLIPGFFKPAGALFPYDIFGNRLRLTWEAGVDTVFYFELAFANSENIKKIPANFDWVRFRELFKMVYFNEAVRKDPWLVDWRYVAEKTISGNFDQRRLVPQTTEAVNIPVHAGSWYGTSPFSEPLFFAEGEEPVFKTHTGINVWISSEGILRCDGRIWFLSPFE